MNKFFVLFVLFAGVVNANEPTLATSDNTQSILHKEAATTAATPAPAASTSNYVISTSAVLVDNSTCTNCDKVVYRRKDNIAPNAVNKTVVISFCESSCEDCKLVSAKKDVAVDICVPPCACKETVSAYRGGRRVVYDFGKYEVVILARRDGVTEVDYRKRLLDR
jgi:hypothetical protein